MANEKGAVVVTGASTGIGRATALHLDERGYTVFAGVRKQADADSLEQEGSERLTPVTIDVAEQPSIDAARQQVQDAVGKEGLGGPGQQRRHRRRRPRRAPARGRIQEGDRRQPGRPVRGHPGLPAAAAPRRGNDRLHHLDRRPRRLALLRALQRRQVRARGHGRLASPRAEALEGDGRRRDRARLDRDPDLEEGRRELRGRLEADGPRGRAPLRPPARGAAGGDGGDRGPRPGARSRSPV